MQDKRPTCLLLLCALYQYDGVPALFARGNPLVPTSEMDTEDAPRIYAAAALGSVKTPSSAVRQVLGVPKTLLGAGFAAAVTLSCLFVNAAAMQAFKAWASPGRAFRCKAISREAASTVRRGHSHGQDAHLGYANQESTCLARSRQERSAVLTEMVQAWGCFAPFALYSPATLCILI